MMLCYCLRPNVYLAHHPTLDMDNLYDNVHLNKENIFTFPKTLKDKYINNKTNTCLTRIIMTNKHGKELLQLWRALSRYIVNGRRRGDSFGHYTYSSSLGSSTVNYAITDLDLSLSEHSQLSNKRNQISKYLKSTHANQPCPNPSKLYNTTTYYRWEQNRLPEYQEAMSSHGTQDHLNAFLAYI